MLSDPIKEPQAHHAPGAQGRRLLATAWHLFERVLNGIKSSLSARLILVGGAAADADPTDMRRTPMVASQMQLLARARENAESKERGRPPFARSRCRSAASP